ncbi:MAG: MarR family transcriptional regulator [Gammaproteobacteria bacterium]|nr:MarR family transcriptional regulator [Gammaproteobacteria bacterium]
MKNNNMRVLNVVELLEGAQIIENKLSVALMYSGLRIPQYRALNIIDNAGKITVTELSKALNVTRATASILANDLIKSGTVLQLDNDSDRRSFYIMMSIPGKQKLSAARKDIAIVQDNISEMFSQEMIELLNSFSKNIRWINK